MRPAFSNALYYPTIDIQNTDWLKTAILFWDSISTIVPESLRNPYKVRDTQYLSDIGFLRPLYVNSDDKSVIGIEKDILEALNPLFSRVKRSRCRSSQEINDTPTPFSALNYCLPIWVRASFNLSNPNIAAYETRNPRTTAATTIYHTTAIALIWQ